MGKHSRNNTNRGFFTGGERKMAQAHWGSKRERVGRDSHKGFGDCTLCLQQAAEPLVCPEGHLFCKECVYENLLYQREEIKAKKLEFEAQEARDQQADGQAEEQRLIDEAQHFEQQESSILAQSATSKRTPSSSSGGAQSSSASSAPTNPSSASSSASAAAASAAPEPEKPQLGCFWVPQLAPDAVEKRVTKPVRRVTQCPAGGHSVRLKELRPCQFTPYVSPAGGAASDLNGAAAAAAASSSAAAAAASGSSSSGDHQLMCPSCRSTFTNSSKIFVLRRCGHVLCATCTTRFVKKEKSCLICSEVARSKDIVSLKGYGTGFASRGNAEAVKTNLGFST